MHEGSPRPSANNQETPKNIRQPARVTLSRGAMPDEAPNRCTVWRVCYNRCRPVRALSGDDRPICGFGLDGQRHFGVDRLQYKHAAQASVSGRNLLTRLRFVLVLRPEVALSI